MPTAELPPLGAWVRVRTNTTPSSPTFLGLVVEHRYRPQPPMALVFNLRGGVLALAEQIAEVLTPEQIAELDCPPATVVQAAYAAGRRPHRPTGGA